MASLKVAGSGSKGNCYIIDTGEKKILLDCGIKWSKIQKSLDFKIADVCGCLVTHEHADHRLSVADIQRNGIICYGNDETQSAIQKINGEIIATLAEKRPFKITDGIIVIPFYVPHTSFVDGEIDDCPNYGYLIEHESFGKLLYATDFEYIKYNFSKLRINHFLVEVNYQGKYIDKESSNFKHVIQGHAELGTTLEFLKRNVTSATRTITFCHLSNENADADEIVAIAKEMFPDVEIFVAKKGLEVNLDLCPF